MSKGDGDGRAEYHCPSTLCEFSTTRPGPLKTHVRFKHPELVVQPLDPASVPPIAEPEAPRTAPRMVGEFLVNDLGQALIPTWRQGGDRLGAGQRMVKMVRPICDICKGPRGWWDLCPHDPYVTIAPMTTQKPVYESVPGVDGAQRVVRVDTIITHAPLPNVHEVAVSRRVNAGRGYQRARHKGELLPADVRSPAFPNGIAPVCQFRSCYNQLNLREYTCGVFCRKAEAQLVWFDQEGKVLEYENPSDDESMEKRRTMLQEAKI